MLTCYLNRRRISPYVDGALEGARARAMAEHLTVCVRCQREVDAVSRLRRIVQAGSRLPVPADWTGFWQGVVRDIETAPARVRAAPRPHYWRPRLAVGGAVAVALAASLTLWQVFSVPLSPSAPVLPVVVRSADSEAPGASVMVYATPAHDMAVVWVFGADD